MTLSLTEAQADLLARMAESAFPREACALLVGRAEADRIAIAEIVPGDNVAASPEREFEFDPAAHIRLLRRLRESAASERLVGHWHSHPNGRAEPSAQDAAMAHDPALIWLISAVENGKAGLPHAYAVGSDGFAPLPVDIIKQDS